jgi:hypothetical protein
MSNDLHARHSHLGLTPQAFPRVADTTETSHGIAPSCAFVLVSIHAGYRKKTRLAGPGFSDSAAPTGLVGTARPANGRSVLKHLSSGRKSLHVKNAWADLQGLQAMALFLIGS